MKERESFGSRLGFLLVSAGCAIGIGNVWRFPYITGKYGGAVFVLFYLFFLFILGWPVMTMELAVGRGSKLSAGAGMQKLAGENGKKWSGFRIFSFIGNFILMMYYTTVAGWMLSYVFEMARGTFEGVSMKGAAKIFSEVMDRPGYMIFWMLIAIVLGFIAVGRGLENGVEKITKAMMIALFVLMSVLAIRSLFLAGGSEGLKFYLLPDINKALDNGIWSVISAAMGQAFFTLSVGIGSIAIFGSYIDKKHSLPKESMTIILLDTFVAIMSGLIIFPACFAYNVKPDAGPSLIFVTLPEVFERMPAGRIWGTLFFVFMCFASMSTVIAVFENIVSMLMDNTGMSRTKSVIINMIAMIILSLPCPLGFSVLSNIHPLGNGTTIMDFEDFIVSNNMLPIGCIVFIIFCTTRYGWGLKNFLEEANTGEGMKMSKKLGWYLKFVLPILVAILIIMGYLDVFG
ncbi:MAG: sodium-dependent transporter [Lachnospiraceae bacterium]|nr:sodium-dependent transporter [Lachnospiraceae bacterium]